MGHGHGELELGGAARASTSSKARRGLRPRAGPGSDLELEGCLSPLLPACLASRAGSRAKSPNRVENDDFARGFSSRGWPASPATREVFADLRKVLCLLKIWGGRKVDFELNLGADLPDAGSRSLSARAVLCSKLMPVPRRPARAHHARAPPRPQACSRLRVGSLLTYRVRAKDGVGRTRAQRRPPTAKVSATPVRSAN